MYTNVTQAFKESILSNSRRCQAQLVSGIFQIDNIKEIRLHRSANTGDTITVGSCVSSYIEVKINGTLSEFIENKEFELSEGVLHEQLELIPMGYFTVEKPSISEGGIQFIAYDRMKKLEKEYVSAILSLKATDILRDIQAQTGVVISIPDTTLSLQYTPYNCSCREVVRMIAELLGKFAYINREGILVFSWYTDIGYQIDGDRYFSLAANNLDYVVKKVQCEAGEDETFVMGTGKGIVFSNPHGTMEIVSGLYATMHGFSYRPSKVKIIGDIRLDIGDIVTVVKGDISYKVPVMNMEQIYDGGFVTVIEAVGNTDVEEENKTSGPMTEKIGKLNKKMLTIEKTVDNFGITLTENLTVNNLLTGTSGTLKDLIVGLYNTLPYGLMIEDTELQTGNTVVFRIYIRNPPEGVVGLAARVSHYNSSGTAVEHSIANLYIEPGDEGYTQVTTRIRADTARLQCGITRKASGTAFTVQVKNAKLEKNTIATEWCMSPAEIDSRVTSNETSINGAIGELVLKVDKGGRIVQVQLGADAESGSVFKVDADNINLSATDVLELLSGGILNLTGKNISIQSNNFVVDKNGNVTCNSIVMERGQGEDYLKIVVDHDEGFIAYGGFINGKSTKIVDFSTNRGMGGIPVPWYHSLMVANTISSSGSAADSTYIDFTKSVIRADTLEGYLNGIAKEAKNAPVTERVSVSRFANSTGYVDITLGNAYKVNSVQATARKTSESSAYVTDIAVLEASPSEGKVRIYGTSTVSGNAVAFNISYIKE